MSEGIRFERLVKRFVPGIGEPKPPQIGPVTFDVPRGKVCSLLGANGAGKSTCIKALLGLIRPTEGRTSILGEPTESEGWRGRVGYLSEQARLPDHLTAEETLRYFGTLKGLRGDQIASQIPALLARLDIGSTAKRLVRGFSKGMQQRLAIGIALLGDPEVLVLDEPMSGLDPLGRRLVRDIMIEHKERGASILFSTHIIPDAEALSDLAVVLSRGLVVVEGSLDDLLGRADSFEVTFVPGSTTEFAAFPTRVRGEAREVAVSNDGLEELLAHIRTTGGRLVTVQPLGRSLEALVDRVSSRSAVPAEQRATQ